MAMSLDQHDTLTPCSLTLEAILSNRNSIEFRDFSAYLQQTYCHENLSFWLTVRDYEENRGSREQCHEIINKYIHSHSPQEINIPCEMRQEILNKVLKDDTDPSIFLQAMDAVTELMRVNSFIPWLMISGCPPLSPALSSFSTPPASPSGSFFSFANPLTRLKRQSRLSFCSLDDDVVSMDCNASVRETQFTLKGRKRSFVKKDAIQNIPNIFPSADDRPSWAVWKKFLR
ncbi:RGS domain-containing protein [Radiomyces spectabilis]|uniref:RGS domain-containing protein n=1 Tax=Radiomyces spectabilis TaxID=64574 RepID=UPI0022202B65|nr:RGS domain-containing protein [Radiomyces spectabilis]KAI8372689.1 RGS domain-containing protein [Radiomyces spectabilis]